MQQAGRPRVEEHLHFGIAAVGQLHRQQAVAPQEGQHGDRQAADEADVQAFHDAETQMRTRGVGQLGAALHRPQHQPGGDHQRAGHAGQEEQPAHRGGRETCRVESDHAVAGDHGGRARRGSIEQFAARVEGEGVVGPGNLVGLLAAHGNAHRRIAWLVDLQRRGMATAPLQFRTAQDLGQCGRRSGYATGFDLFRAREQVGEERIASTGVVRVHRPRHVQRHQGDQAGVGDHQVERQRQHRQRVVAVQPGALALAAAEGEEVGEDLLVGDDPADDRHQHQHGTGTDEPARPQHRYVVQIEMQAIEEVATACLAHLHRGAVGIQGGLVGIALATPAFLFALRLPTDGGGTAARIGQFDAPALRVRCSAGQELLGLGDGGRGLGGQADFRLHPAGQFFLPVRCGTGNENQEQHPADHQARPGVQHRLRLADAAQVVGAAHA